MNELIEQGRRLSKPEKCPDDIYRLMLDCWQRSDRLRPNFQFLAKFFINQHKCVNANVPTDENCSDSEDGEKHSNTVYV